MVRRNQPAGGKGADDDIEGRRGAADDTRGQSGLSGGESEQYPHHRVKIPADAPRSGEASEALCLLVSDGGGPAGNDREAEAIPGECRAGQNLAAGGGKAAPVRPAGAAGVRL